MNKKLFHFAILLALFLSVYLIFSAFYNKKNADVFLSNPNNKLIQNSVESKPLSIVIISDTHLNTDSYKYLKEYLISNPTNAVFHLGDHTDYGDSKSLLISKNFIEELATPYFVLAGDHDIAETSSLLNFNNVFKTTPKIKIGDVKIALVNNPFNYSPFSEFELNTILDSIQDSDLILSSQPIYVPEDNFFSYKYMGSLENISNLSIEQQSLLKKYNYQSKTILSKIRETKKDILVISGDHHKSSNFSDPINSRVKYHITGALAKYIYLGSKQYSQKALQTPRFSVISISKNSEGNSFEIKEQLIEN